VFTAARRFCAAVLTAPSAVTTPAPAPGINPAAGGAIPLAALPGQAIPGRNASDAEMKLRGEGPGGPDRLDQEHR